MLKRLSTIVLLLIAASPLLAGEPSRRTVIVRDGKVVLDEGGPAGKRAFIGVAMTQLSPELREFFGAPKTAGVLVSSVTPNGPAAKAGIRVGDVITAVNGEPVASFRGLVNSIKDNHAGDAIRIDVIRAKSRQTLVATAEERESSGLLGALDLSDLHLGDLQLGDLPHNLGALGPGWRARIASPEDEELRSRIHDLETRLQELEKKLQQK
jgi:membrane-associated protease RseP (regulator of RpoE activity)